MKPSPVPKDVPSSLRLSPGTRTALIIGGLFCFFIIWTIYWVAKKALDIKHQRQETTRVSTPATGDMVWIPGGSFTMGGNGPQAASDEAPLHDVKLSGFWIDRTEVTNAQFAEFLSALPVKPSGTALGGLVKPENIPPEHHAPPRSVHQNGRLPLIRESD